MAIPDGVGLEIRELMRGTVTRVGEQPSAISFDTTQVMESLNAFCEGAAEVDGRVGHVCSVRGGEVIWHDGGVAQRCPITGGTIEMFREVPGHGGRYQQFEFNLTFRTPAGLGMTLKGWKELLADGPIQILDALKDLSTLRNVAVVDATGHTIATGELYVTIPDLVAQMQSLRITNANAGEAGRARTQFLAFMNDRLAEVYSVFPSFFHEEHSVFWRQYLLVQVLLDIFIPGEKAARAADVIAELEKYLENSRVELLDNVEALIRVAEQLFGAQITLCQEELRKWVRANLALGSPDKGLHDRLRSVHQLLVAGYYACADVDATIGYERAATAHLDKIPSDEKLAVRPRPIKKKRYDVVIIGSGVAGSLLAQRLSVEQGKSVCLLEAGRYHHERSFSADELDSMSKVYMRGGMQAATDPGWKKDMPPRDVTVLQARAVGGGGLVNNAVCFRLPADRLKAWQDFGFPISESDLDGAYNDVAAELGIVPVSQALKSGARLNPMVARLKGHFGNPVALPGAIIRKPGFYECNVNMGKKKCRGCGYCNLGCTWEAKQNSLQVHLRSAVDEGGAHVIPLAHVDELVFENPRTVKAARATIGDERWDVEGAQFVVAAGPLHSSALLLRSGLGQRNEPSAKYIGRRLSANIGAPVLAFTKEPLGSAGSLQISHFYWPAESPGFVIETWFNPPAAQAMVIPGYFEDHRARMGAYSYLGIAAPLVGTFPGGWVDRTGKMTFPLLQSDLARVHAGQIAIAEALFAGAKDELDYLLMSTEHGVTVYDEADLAAYRQLSDLRSIVVGTGHPQGGNAMFDDKNGGGPVANDFRVRGVDNLRVCDGSVFPDCAGINPQWTIMALAHLCAQRM